MSQTGKNGRAEGISFISYPYIKHMFQNGHKILFHAYSTMMTLVLVYALALFGVSAQRLPVNRLATEATVRVLEFFFELRDNDQLLLGQDLGHGSSEKNGIVSGYQKYVETLHTKIGKYVGFIGGDYGLDPNGDIEAMNTVLINHHKKGGIVTISWHFYNPWTGGDVWDTNKQENLWELIETSTCTSACQNWQRDKNNVANALRPLRDAGVPVLWRPFHEMNGDWFWWGRKVMNGHEDAYIALWHDMFNFLTTKQKLNNLLWVFSAANTFDRTLKNYFPGSNFVDIVGIDIYDDNVQSAFSQRDYNDLKSLGDYPMGLTEFGPTVETANGQYDYRRLLKSLKSTWQDFCFSYSWSNWMEGSQEVSMAYVSNQFISEAFTRPEVITLDKMTLPINPLPSRTPLPRPSITQSPSPKKRPTTRPPRSSPTKRPQKPVINPSPKSEFRIKNRETEMYLTLSGNFAGARVTLKSLNSGWWSQRWLRLGAGDFNFPMHDIVQSKWENHLFLNTDDEGIGVFVGKLDKKLWSMRWNFEQVSSNTFRIINMWKSECLTAQEVSQIPKLSILVRMEECNPNYWTQQWILERVST